MLDTKQNEPNQNLHRVLLFAKPMHHPRTFALSELGGSVGVVNSLDFFPASLKSLGCFYFQCTFFTMEGGDSEFANFTLPTLKTFLEARSQNVSGNKQ